MRQYPSASSAALYALAALASCAYAADSTTTATATTTSMACTASSTSGAYYDLTLDIAVNKSSAPSNWEGHGPDADYKVRGYDYGSNFTLNICDPLVEPVTDVVGVEENLWRNVSAYYKAGGETFSLGLSNGELTPRGKELVLQYTGGSPCGSSGSSRSRRDTRRNVARSAKVPVHDGATYKQRPDELEEYEVDANDYDDDDEDDVRRKSALILFSCDKDPTAESAFVSYIGHDPDECSYVFKVRSQHACAGAEPHKPGSLGPGAVFGIILAVAVMVYFLGGIFYNRTISNARGWKQLPNYTFWASIWSFISASLPEKFRACFPGGKGTII